MFVAGLAEFAIPFGWSYEAIQYGRTKEYRFACLRKDKQPYPYIIVAVRQTGVRLRIYIRYQEPGKSRTWEYDLDVMQKAIDQLLSLVREPPRI